MDSDALADGAHQPLLTSTSLEQRGSSGWQHRSKQAGPTKSEEGQTMVPPWIILPTQPAYGRWWGFTIAAAIVSGVFVPYAVGFCADPGDWPLSNPAVMVDNSLQLIFLVDMLIAFRLAFRENEVLVTDGRRIALHYLRLRFWVDLAGWVPFDFVAMFFCPHCSLRTAQFLSLLRLLHLFRLYRIKWWFAHLEYNVAVSLLITTLLRNLLIVFYVTHMAACGFYFIALQMGFGPNTWIGAHFGGDVDKVPIFTRYCWALFWAITTLATVGYGDPVSQNLAEAIWATIYMYTNLALSAYILGSITLLVVKSDEAAGHFRDSANAMKQYTKQHNIPQGLEASMNAHLRLAFANRAASDEAVLQDLPTPLRRRILRHMYLEQLTATALFRDARQRFLDALLGVARIELFMPQMEMLSSGDFVNELFVVVSGQCEQHHLGPVAAADSRHSGSKASKSHGSLMQDMGPGECFGEVAFFTGRSIASYACIFPFEVPQMASIRSRTTCRVLVVTRDAYKQLESAFPLSARAVLQNLLSSTEQMVRERFSGSEGQEKVEQVLQGHHPHLQYGWASPEMAEDRQRDSCGPRPDREGPAPEDNNHQDHCEDDALQHRQEQAVASLLRLRDLVKQFIARQDGERVSALLYAASNGDVSTVRQMIHQGQDPNASDYDGRTALMLACMKGHKQLVQVLLDAKADAAAKDSMGTCALLEACQHGHDAIIDLLLKDHSLLDVENLQLAGRLCSAVFKGDVVLLERLLKAGAPPETTDYDGRTALHVAAAEGHMGAAKALVKAGGKALVQQGDRWERTPLMEAESIKSEPLIKLLKSAQ